MVRLIFRNIPNQLQRIIKINTSWPKNGGERQRKLTTELLKECWIVMHVKIYTSYINVVIRCLFEMAKKKLIDKELLGNKEQF